MALNAEQLAIFKKILADPVNGPIVEAQIDQRVTQAIETFKLKNPPASEAVIRIKNIQNEYETKLKAAELRNQVLQACHSRGIDFGMIDRLGIQFKDAAEIAPRLDQFAAEIEAIETRKINDRIVSQSYQPMSGDSHRTIKPDDLNFAEALKMEQGGRLDGLLRGQQ